MWATLFFHLSSLHTDSNISIECGHFTMASSFKLFFRENKAGHFMWIICIADDSHEMSSLSWKLIKKNTIKMSSVAVIISECNHKVLIHRSENFYLSHGKSVIWNISVLLSILSSAIFQLLYPPTYQIENCQVSHYERKFSLSLKTEFMSVFSNLSAAVKQIYQTVSNIFDSIHFIRIIFNKVTKITNPVFREN